MTVDVVNCHVFTCSRDELADCGRQLFGTAVVESDPIKREANIWIDDADGGELVGEAFVFS
jgi:hypothetical protein